MTKIIEGIAALTVSVITNACGRGMGIYANEEKREKATEEGILAPRLMCLFYQNKTMWG